MHRNRRIGIAVAAVLGAAAPGIATAADADGELEEVVVTGLKREQRLVDVPVSVNVFTTELIEKAGIERPQDFLNLASNVSFIQTNHAGEAFVNIRGQASVRQAESAVAVVIDGVQLATQNEFNGELFDVQQIEVLKGPQGAIYGRNATAGALIITTRPPTDEFGGAVTLNYGNWNTMKLTGGVGGALIPGKLRFRVSGALSDTDGPFDNVVTGEKMYRAREKTGRLRLDWVVNDDVSVDFRVGGSRLDGGGIAAHAQVLGSTVNGYTVSRFDTNDLWRIPYVTDVPGYNLQKKSSVSVKLDWQLGVGTLTSVTAYSRIDDIYQAKNFPYADYTDPTTDFGVFEAVFGDRTQKYRIFNRAFTQEVRLASPDEGRVRWMVGAYFLSSKKDFWSLQGLNTGGSIAPTLAINGPGTVNPTSQYDLTHYTARNWAPFANLQIDLAERVELGIAARYDRERRTGESRTPNVPNLVAGTATYNLCVLNTGLSADQCRGEKTFTQLQPKVTLTWKPTDDGSVFLSYGKGFKSGGFNPIGTRQTLLNAYIAAGADPSTVFVQDAYDKETSNAYEIGFKSEWLDRRLSVNGAVFRTDVKGAQQFEFNPIAGIQAVSSIDEAKIEGAEIEIQARPTDSLQLFASYGYLDSTIRELRAQPLFNGNRTPYSTNSTLNAGLQYGWAMAGSLSGTLRFDWTRSGTMWFDAGNQNGTRRDPVALANLRIGVSSERWDVALWSRNLFDERYTSEVVPLVEGLLQAGFPGIPRSYGFEARVRF